jgi:hypothetical protein
MVAFRCYNPTAPKDEALDAWRAALPPEFNSAVDAEMALIARDQSLEESGRFKALRGRCLGLTQIMIDFVLDADETRNKPEEVHIRILGFGTARDFVLLYGFRKRGDRDYGRACHAALNRKRGVERDGRRAQPCGFP